MHKALLKMTILFGASSSLEIRAEEVLVFPRFSEGVTDALRCEVTLDIHSLSWGFV